MGKFIYLRRNLFKLYLSFHSYSQLWLTNWGHTQDSPPDSNDIMSLARYGADMLKKKHGTTFKVGSPASILYSAAGASFDWAKGVAKIKYAYTLELRDTGRFGFILPPNQILPVGEEVWGAVKSIAARIYHEVRDAKDMFYTV
ncbi:carboxypeptidase B-like [Lingula anatina]|nr:carboxypeptidase B-like [Lingula anatina]|eukprot:XP_013421751.1 carboxypeptidase B-like [Lingula anatina]